MGVYVYHGEATAYGRKWPHVFFPNRRIFYKSSITFQEVRDWSVDQFGPIKAWNDVHKHLFPDEKRRFCGGHGFYFDDPVEAMAFRLRWC